MARAAAKSPDRPETLRRAVLSFDEVLGQERATDALRQALESRRIHHAWVFAGPAGVGKFTTAVAFAALLLDPALEPDLSGRLAADPDSQTQRLIRAGTHPDLHIVSKELAAVSREERIRAQKQTTIAKEVLREFLMEPAARTRVMPGDSAAGKVFIIDEADLLDAGGQNTLLKVLEEPPAGTIFVLITQQEERLLPTIRSRCRRVGFYPLPAEAMSRWLNARGVDAARRERVLDLAAGSPGAAAEIIEHQLELWADELAPLLSAAARGEFAPGLGAAMARLVEERAAHAVKTNPDASKDAANKTWSRRMLAFVAEDLRRRLPAAKNQAALERVLRAIDAVRDAEDHVMSNVQPAFAFENMAAAMSA